MFSRRMRCSSRRSFVKSFPFLEALMRGRSKRSSQSNIGEVAEILEDRTLLTPIVLGNGNEPFIAIDPSDSDNIVVGANGLGAVFSTDGGLNFSGSSVPAGYRGDAGLAIDSNGQIFLSYLITDALAPPPPPSVLDIAISSTTFGNQNFATNQINISVGNQSDDKELIAADHFTTSPFRDNLYVAWRRLGPEQVLYSRSTDGGTTFSAPAAIAAPVNTFTSGADPEVGPNGEVYVAYWDGSNIGGDVGEIRVLKSTDGGANFFNPVAGGGAISFPAGTVGLDSTGLDHNAVLPRNQSLNQNFRWDVRTMLDIEADPLRAGYVYATWLTDPDGTTAGDASNVMFSRSTDGGVNWSFPTVLNDDGGGLAQHMPSLGVDEAGNLTAIWYDERLSTNVNDPNLTIFAKVSLDGGVTWSSDFALDDSTFDPDIAAANTFIGDYIQVAAANGFGYATWTQTDSTGTNQILFEKYSLQAAFADSYEPNNSLGNATVLGSEPKVTLRDLTIHDEDDVDWFKITANETGKLVINAIFEHNVGDIDLQIQDMNGNLLGSSQTITDNEQIVIPVVSQEMYFLRVNGFADDTNVYDLEIENFAAHVPSGVHLDPASDTGMMNNDNNTADNTPRYIIQADLTDFDAMGITVLTPAQANAGTTAGAAVEILITNSATGVTTTGFASQIGASTILFDFTPAASLGDGVYFVSSAVRIFDGQNPVNATRRSQLSEPLWMTVDTVAPSAGVTPILLSSSDSGMLSNDMVTNKMSPAFSGTGEPAAKVRVFANGLLVGQGVVNTFGLWEVTVEPLTDGHYNITTEFEDVAGNVSDRSPIKEIWIDTVDPNTPFLDLLTDSGRHDADNITNVNRPAFRINVDDTPNGGLNVFPNDVKYRVFLRPGDFTGEILIYDSYSANGNNFVNGGQFTHILSQTLNNPAGVPFADGVYDLKLEVEDRAGNMSHDFLLGLTIDTVAPPVSILDIDPATSDSGVPGYPDTIVDRITSDTTTGFYGNAEADAIVRMWADGVPISSGVINAFDTFQGLTVAIPLDGNQQFPFGQWNLTGQFDLNDPNAGIGFPLDGLRQIGVTAEDVAGNVSAPDFLDIFIDTQGPRVFDPDGGGPQQAIQVITAGVPNATFDLFDIKPTLGPTPRTDGLLINVSDLPNRVTAFLYNSLQEGTPSLAENPGNYQLTGDTVGNVAISNITVINAAPTEDEPATATIRLDFFEPLQDDRYTLTLRDSLVDPAGNALDGESNANEPNDGPNFPSGDGIPGGDFVARFTVDSRAEIGTWGQSGVFIDANGNYLFDAPVAGGINHDVSRDLVFDIGIQTDNIFAGQFKPAGAVSANGYDRIGAYGLIGGTYRFLLDFNDNGRIDVGESITSNVQVNAFPIAGNFDGNAANGDEIGLFDGATWYFDTTGDNLLDTTVGGGLRGLPITGDFDGDGRVDLGTHIASSNAFFFSLSGSGGSLAGGNSNTTDTFAFGFPGVLERPFSGGDFNLDGIDDFGLTTPSQDGTDGELEWYIVVSDHGKKYFQDGEGGSFGGAPAPGIADIFDAFTPTPLGNDIFTLFNGTLAAPVVGNFDPPNSLSSTAEFQPLASTTDTTPTLEWNNVGGASEYEVLLYNVDLGQQVAHDLVGANSFTPTVTADNNYQSFVRPVNNYGEAGSWSSPYNFSIDGLTVPVVTSPVDATDDATPTIVWTSSDGATSYNVLVYSLSTGQEVVHAFGESGTTYTSSTPLPGAGEYQVFVQAADASGTSNWSAAHVFALTASVSSLPGSPTVTEPTGTTNDSTPTVVWTAGVNADSYDMLVYNTSSGQEVVNETGLVGTSFTLVTPLAVSGTHQIFMRSVNDLGTSGWNGPFTFDLVLEGNAAPSAPTLLSPSETFGDFTPTFDWTASNNAATYELLVYQIETGQQVIWQNNLTTTSYTPSDSLPGAAHYQVFLRATNGFGSSAWSTPSTIELVASLDDSEAWTLQSHDVEQAVVDETANATDTSEESSETATKVSEKTIADNSANEIETASTENLDAVMAQWNQTDWWQKSAAVK